MTCPPDTHIQRRSSNTNAQNGTLYPSEYHTIFATVARRTRQGNGPGTTPPDLRTTVSSSERRCLLTDWRAPGTTQWLSYTAGPITLPLHEYRARATDYSYSTAEDTHRGWQTTPKNQNLRDTPPRLQGIQDARQSFRDMTTTRLQRRRPPFRLSTKYNTSHMPPPPPLPPPSPPAPSLTSNPESARSANTS